MARFFEVAGSFPSFVSYGGYGNTHRARVMGRVLMSRTGDQRNWLGERRGWRQYIDAQSPRQPVMVTLGDSRQLVYADSGGYLDLFANDHGLAPGWHAAEVRVVDRRSLAAHADLAAGRPRALNAHARLGRPTSVPIRIVGDQEQLGVVSDVDDTILVSRVARTFLALRYMLVDNQSGRRAVPGMAAFLRNLQAKASRVGHGRSTVPGGKTGAVAPPPIWYLSASAWNTAPTLRRFLARCGYPHGSLLLRAWGISAAGAPPGTRRHKKSELALLLEMFPQMRLVLVGDNGQHDQSIYGDVARQAPGRIAAIFIRTLSDPEHFLSHGLPRPLEREGSAAEGPAGGGAEDGTPVYYGSDGFEMSRVVNSARFRELLEG